MDNPPDDAGFDSSLLIVFSIGLGSVALVLAVVATYLLVNRQGAFTKTRYRSNRVSPESLVESPEPSERL